MRYPAEHKTDVRARIVRAAARALRKTGLLGVSIPALMKQAGLTHGGFYAHFRDRDELVAEAVGAAADETTATVFEKAGQVEALLARYLSEAHVRHPEHGCVVAALGAEAPHQSPSVRRAFAGAGRQLLRNVQRALHPASPPDELCEDSLQLAARMVGAVVLSRVVDDPALVARILQAAQQR